MDKPKFETVDLTELQDGGVLMAANEAFFWRLGLALTWEHQDDAGATNLHVREWHWPDGHHESIALAPTDAIATQRREAFAAWVTERNKTMPEAERIALDDFAAK